ncbi:DUF4041 domain-containing protein [Actinomadura sp. WAC 06369]|uniref:DUF4041 domain-containing protein n=1 Tax=Actinomadura sp. WAC 06369 TaxID=2203193 RepID=UPI000F77BCB1|nr:DUF4041 domain-containing protein [Actinomadura sp. WAC 06369]RSN62442.1 DUF4041 domain-containing protein [Actinomadura sp. WAC 06369]
MTGQTAPRAAYIGIELGNGEEQDLRRALGLYLKSGESLLAITATVKVLPTLTHVAVTDRRVLGFSAADLVREGPRRELAIADAARIEIRRSYKQRWFLVAFRGAGDEVDFGDVHDEDAPRLHALVAELIRARDAAPGGPGRPSPAPAGPVSPTEPVRPPEFVRPAEPAASVPFGAPDFTAPAPPVPAPAPPPPVPSAPPTAAPGPVSTVPPGAPGWRYNPPPTWPAPPAGWAPPPGWRPDPSWPPAPPEWRFWLPAASVPAPAHVPAPSPAVPAPAGFEAAAPRAGTRSVPRFGGRKQRIEVLEAENVRLRDCLERLGGLEAAQVAAEIERLRAEAADVRRDAEKTRIRLENLRSGIVETEDTALLQEAGIYEYQHPLADSVAYKAELAKVRDRIKSMARNNRAVVGATNWTVNGSAAQGGKMVRDFSKLMLRAYNAEADNLVRTMRPYKLQAAIDRLDKSAQTIERLGKTMDIRVSRQYRDVRITELRLTADHLAKLEEEKERVRAEREQQREEEKARKEFEREKARLLKERSHVEAALARLEERGDGEGAAELRAKLADVDDAISDVEGRAAKARAGYVYVISNIGAFGERMVKIGMTRRLDPMDRVRELGDASVPFRFDVHALIFSEDAVGLEGDLHREFAERRVNRVNMRREFFYATPAEVRRALERIAGAHLVEYTETPEAVEFRAGGGREGQSLRPTPP